MRNFQVLKGRYFRYKWISLFIIGSLLPLFFPPSIHGQVLGPEEQRLFDLINRYRKENGLPAIPHAPSLTMVAQFHVRDLHFNQPNGGNCNLHSWSSSDKWSACCYTSDHSQAKCMWSKPKELTSYTGHGYEIACMSGDSVDAFTALDIWKNSAAHNAVVINQGNWSVRNWKAMGVGVFKQYAVVWFGEEPDGVIKSDPVPVTIKSGANIQAPSAKSTEKSSKAIGTNRTRAALVLGFSGNYIHNKTELAFDSMENLRFYGSVDGLLGIKFGIKRQKSVFGIYGSTAMFTSSDSVLFDNSEYSQNYATQIEYGLGFIHRGWVGVMLGYGHSGRSVAFADMPRYYSFANMTWSIPIRRLAIGLSGKVILENNGFYVRNIQTGAHLRFTI